LQFSLSGDLLSVAEEWEKLACLVNGYPQAQLDSLLTLLISHAGQVHLALESVMHTASECMGHVAVSGQSAHALGDLGGLCPGSQPFSCENPEPAGRRVAAVFLQNSATHICCSQCVGPFCRMLTASLGSCLVLLPALSSLHSIVGQFLEFQEDLDFFLCGCSVSGIQSPCGRVTG
jgi:hypothetical protein